MHKISVQSTGIVTEAPDKGFAMLAAAGIEAVDFDLYSYQDPKQMAAGEPGFYDRPLEALLAFFKPFKESARRHGITFGQAHAPYPPCPPGKPVRPHSVDIVKKCIAVCSFLECPLLVVHPANLAWAVGRDAEREANLQFYTALLPAAQQYGVGICLENMFRSVNARVQEAVCSDPYQAADYIDTLNGIAGAPVFSFCFDTGHANLLKKDPLQFLQVLGSRVQALHIHENDGTYDMHLLPFTQGVDRTKYTAIDWGRFLEGLRSIGYGGNINFEIHNVWYLLPEAAHPAALGLVRALGEYMKNKIKE